MAYNISAMVVLYNPQDTTYECIASYLDQVPIVYVIDNSTSYNQSLIERLRVHEKVVYINSFGNFGIAQALNVGAKRAIADGFKFLVTMDQDTILDPGFVITLLKCIPFDGWQNVGILAPRYTPPHVDSQDTEEVTVTMTSGNILNLDAFQQVGPYMEKLFIDHVDHEFCLRLWASGFKVIQGNSVGISHRPGELLTFQFFGKEISFSSHSPIRQYYLWRNGFYVSKLYKKKFPSFNIKVRHLLIKEFLKVPFESHKIVRLKMMIKGFLDYQNGKFGPL